MNPSEQNVDEKPDETKPDEKLGGFLARLNRPFRSGFGKKVKTVGLYVGGAIFLLYCTVYSWGHGGGFPPGCQHKEHPSFCITNSR
jgi:hypothetical protein